MFSRQPQSPASPEIEAPETESSDVEMDTADISGEAEAAVAAEQADKQAANTANAGDVQPQAKYQQLEDQFKRLAADFENFRKRTREEQAAQARYGAQSTVEELLPVLDNLERATASLNENSDPKVLYKSFQLVYKQLTDGFGNLGLTKIAAIGQPFDPNEHEAVSRMASAEVAENSVLHEAQSGYKLHDKVLRPAQVVVSMGSPDETPDAKADNPFGAQA